MDQITHWKRLSLLEGERNNFRRYSTKHPRIYLGKEHPSTYLTQREAQCVYYLMKTGKRKTVASTLQLSERTVEAYITSARSKIDCHSQIELIKLIPNTDFMVNYAELIGETREN